MARVHDSKAELGVIKTCYPYSGVAERETTTRKGVLGELTSFSRETARSTTFGRSSRNAS